MTNNQRTHLSQNGLPRRLQQREVVTTLRSVRQDNPAPQRERIASTQPAPPNKDTRARQSRTKRYRSQNNPIPKRRTVQVIIWVKPVVKAELQRIAEQKGLSISATGAAFLEHALEQNLYTQHTALFDPIISKAIGKHLRAYSNRIAVLLVRSLFTSEQTRSIVVNILSRQDGITQKELATIITASENKARGNIARVTPQLKTLIEAVQRQLSEEVTAGA